MRTGGRWGLLIAAIVIFVLLILLPTGTITAVFAYFGIVAAVLALVAAVLIALLREMGILTTRDGRASKRKEEQCLRVPPSVWKKPDPFLYAQLYLMSQGLEVVWWNPDIWLEDPAVPNVRIEGEPLAQKDYDIVAQVWNGSFEAPAFNVLAEFFVAISGVGLTVQPAGAALIPVVQVRGLGPSQARVRWRPAQPGHHCIVVRIKHPDDANPNNNEGQWNLEVVQATPNPGTTLRLRLHNPRAEALGLNLTWSVYRLPEPRELGQRLARAVSASPWRNVATPGFAESTQPAAPRRALPRRALMSQTTDFRFRSVAALVRPLTVKLNSRGIAPVPADWRIEMPANPIRIPPRQSQIVNVRVGLPAGVPPGSYDLSVTAVGPMKEPYGGMTYRIQVR